MTPRISHCDRVSNPIDMSLWQKRERERGVLSGIGLQPETRRIKIDVPNFAQTKNTHWPHHIRIYSHLHIHIHIQIQMHRGPCRCSKVISSHGYEQPHASIVVAAQSFRNLPAATTPPPFNHRIQSATHPPFPRRPPDIVNFCALQITHPGIRKHDFCLCAAHKKL